MLLCAGIPTARAIGPAPAPDPTVPAGRDTEPIVLQGSAFADWAAPAELTAKAPAPGGALCTGGDDTQCTHNQYEEPEVATGSALGEGVPVDRMLGYRWDDKAGEFAQIPFQVDELAVRYLSNNESGVLRVQLGGPAPDLRVRQERFRWTAEDPAEPLPCGTARRRATTSADPVPGLDTDDEVAFMASDSGPAAPADASLPDGRRRPSSRWRSSIRRNPSEPRYVYVMLAADARAPKPAFTARNGYVRYEPDADSDTLPVLRVELRELRQHATRARGSTRRPSTCVTERSASSTGPRTRRGSAPRATRSATTGRWLMTELQVATTADDNTLDATTKWKYGPDLVDQWKARAFQQRPGGETPCCGYEEEVNNWGGSSILMGVAGRPGACHPRHVGRGLVDQQRAHRDLLPRRDPRRSTTCGCT